MHQVVHEFLCELRCVGEGSSGPGTKRKWLSEGTVTAHYRGGGLPAASGYIKRHGASHPFGRLKRTEGRNFLPALQVIFLLVGNSLAAGSGGPRRGSWHLRFRICGNSKGSIN